MTCHIISCVDAPRTRYTWSHSSVTTSSTERVSSAPTRGKFEADLRAHRDWLQSQVRGGHMPVKFEHLDDRIAYARFYDRHLASAKTIAIVLIMAAFLMAPVVMIASILFVLTTHRMGERQMWIRIIALLLGILAAPGVLAASPPIKAVCIPLDVAQQAQVEPICNVIGKSSKLRLQKRKDVWKVAAKHGMTREDVTGSDLVYMVPASQSVMQEFDIEALIVVEIRSDEKAALVAFANDGSRSVVPFDLDAGKLSDAPAAKVAASALRETSTRIDEFRNAGGWAGTVTERDLQGLDPNERATVQFQKTARCYRFEGKWYFCQPERIGTRGFVWGQKGKPMRYVKAGGSYSSGAHLQTFEEPGFERAGDRLHSSSRDFDPFVDANAPAFIIKPRESRAALLCGQKTEFLKALNPADSRALLADLTIRFAPPKRSVGLRKTEEGRYVWIEVVQHASGDQEHRVFVGKPPRLKELRIVDQARSSSATSYRFDGGGELILPANKAMFSPSSRDKTKKTETGLQVMPDGSRYPKNATFLRGFRWATYLEKEGATAENLYIVDDAERQKLFAAVIEPPPVDNEDHQNAVCATVMPSAKNK